MSETWVEAVDAYVAKRELGADYALDVFTLRKLAESLDKRMSAMMVGQFVRVFAILKRSVGDADGSDPLDDMLDELGI